MNTLTIAGNIGRDAELRTTQNGKKVANFTVAVSGRRKDDPPTWFDCSLWGDRADKLAQYIRKGDKIAVTGEVGAREHNGKAYLQVNVRDLTFMGGGNAQLDQSAGTAYGGTTGGAPDMDDEIPF
jgi:single-strand DNA-binding protein